MGQIIFEQGDLVRVIESKEIKHWNCWRDAIGQECYLDQEDCDVLNNEGAIILFNNRYSINFCRDDLELVNRDWDR